MKRFVEMLKETFSRWSDDESPRLGAALAFYTILSLSPLLVLAVGIAALVFGAGTAQQAIMEQAEAAIGAEGAKTVATAMQSARQPAAASIAGILSLVVLLFGASGVFVELRAGLNKVWDVPPAATSGIGAWIKDRLVSMGMVLGIGILLLVFLAVSTALAVVARAVPQAVPIPGALMQVLAIVVGLAGFALVFAVVFRYVPQTDIQWRLVWPGALFAAVLFEIGRLALGIYLRTAAVGSAYGAAGSLVVVIVWLYYTSQIFYFGAEFTRVWAGHHGWQPEQQPAAEEAVEEPVPVPARPPAAEPSGRPAPQPVWSRVLAAGALAAVALRFLRRQ